MGIARSWRRHQWSGSLVRLSVAAARPHAILTGPLLSDGCVGVAAEANFVLGSRDAANHYSPA